MTDGVTDNEGEQRYELVADGAMAVLEYKRRGNDIVFLHTEVPSALEGKGIGSRIVRAALADAQERGLHVVPQCPFVKAYLAKHPDSLQGAGRG